MGQAAEVIRLNRQAPRDLVTFATFLDIWDRSLLAAGLL